MNETFNFISNELLKDSFSISAGPPLKVNPEMQLPCSENYSHAFILQHLYEMLSSDMTWYDVMFPKCWEFREHTEFQWQMFTKLMFLTFNSGSRRHGPLWRPCDSAAVFTVSWYIESVCVGSQVKSEVDCFKALMTVPRNNIHDSLTGWMYA